MIIVLVFKINNSYINMKVYVIYDITCNYIAGDENTPEKYKNVYRKEYGNLLL